VYFLEPEDAAVWYLASTKYSDEDFDPKAINELRHVRRRLRHDGVGPPLQLKTVGGQGEASATT
jgi:hypothetical protein